MTQAKRFFVRGQPLAAQPYEYRASGLDNISLANGFELKETAHGQAVFIQDVDSLHQAIGRSIVNDSKAISPRELRFLRKNMDLTQEELAAMFRVDAQTIARYEKDQTAIPHAIDRLMRIMFTFHIIPPEKRMEFVEMIKAILDDDLPQGGFDRDLGGVWRERCPVPAH